ncbi:hypothetical protein [Marivirga sp.]|uniref:hypothetical protein n=1 Tax=Marivirga sp. TaxID=2018662 RepID=UPI003DA6E108
MKLIESHSTYTTAFRNLAIAHKDILHDPNSDKTNFARIVLNRDPYLNSHAEIREFLTAIESTLATPFMLLQSYVVDYVAKNRDNKRKVMQGAFIILDKVEEDNFNNQEEVFDKTERIGEELLGWLDNYYLENMGDGILEHSANENEKIGKILDGYYGTRFHVAINISAESKLAFKPDQFNEI